MDEGVKDATHVKESSKTWRRRVRRRSGSFGRSMGRRSRGQPISDRHAEAEFLTC